MNFEANQLRNYMVHIYIHLDRQVHDSNIWVLLLKKKKKEKRRKKKKCVVWTSQPNAWTLVFSSPQENKRAINQNKMVVKVLNLKSYIHFFFLISNRESNIVSKKKKIVNPIWCWRRRYKFIFMILYHIFI